jgi:hypothetical protein
MITYVGILEVDAKSAKVIYKADMQKATLLGRLYMLQHPGFKVTAREIAGRSFSKYDKETLQYLYWNTFGLTPSDDYNVLIQDIVKECEKLPLSETENAWLESQISEYDYKTEITPSGKIVYNNIPKPPQKTNSEKSEQVSRPPRTGTTTALVWEIVNEQYKTITDLKKLREVCQDIVVNKEGINASTFSVQFSKWKKETLG